MVGLEPTRPLGHQTLILARLPTPPHRDMVPLLGFEPRRLSAPGFEPGASAVPPKGRKMVRATGFEPARHKATSV